MVRALSVVIALLAAGATARGDAPSFQELVSGLSSPSTKTREQSAAALGKSRLREAVPHLAGALKDPEKKVRLEAMRGLRELRAVEAAQALAQLLGDPEVELRREAASTLMELYAGARSGPVRRVLDVFSDGDIPPTVGAGAGVHPDVHAALARALRDEDERVRARAAEALGLLEARDNVRDVSAALLDPAKDVRSAAVVSLAQIGGPEDGRALLPLLADESSEVQSLAVQAAARLKVTEAAPVLRQMYEANARKESGLRALAALSRIGDPAQADLFQELVADTDPTRKRLAVEGLARISDGSRLPGFKKDYQRERNEEVRLAYAFALVRLGDPAFVDTLVLSLGSRTIGERSREYLLELGRGVLPELYAYLGDPDAAVRAALCDVIAAAGDPSAIPRLSPLLNDASGTVADRAHLAVERLRRLEAASGGR